MWIENETLKEDLESLILSDFIEWEKFRNKTFFISGATGVIGFNLISGLVYANIQKNLNMKIIALVRDYKKAKKKYEEHMNACDCLEFVVGDVIELPEIEECIDYIIHAASPTASHYFIENPVETIKISVLGTMNVLELAREKRIKGMVYTSSMEIYGAPKTEEMLSEEDVGYMNPLVVRNCYPEGKRQCESMCASYASEYQVPVISVRLAQTFGLGIEKNDGRVFAEFARCAIEKKDIVLLTDGSSKRCYLYTMDAASAILTVLTKGESGTAYNAGNPETYCSVREMAEMVVSLFGEGSVNVSSEENFEKNKRFSPPHFYNLGIARISKLGWRPLKELREMYQRMIKNIV